MSHKKDKDLVDTLYSIASSPYMKKYIEIGDDERKYDEHGREIDEDGVVMFWSDLTEEEKRDILSDEKFDGDNDR